MGFKSVLTAACGAVFAAGVGAANAAPVYVQSVLAFEAGTGTRDDVSLATVVGAPTQDFLSLGMGGMIALSFGDGGPFTGASVVFERTDNCTSADIYALYELPTTSQVFDLAQWGDAVGTVTNSDGGEQVGANVRGYSLNISEAFNYLLIVDTSTDGAEVNAGWDLAGVSVAPIPVPAALPLLLVGLGGIALVGRRRNKAA